MSQGGKGREKKEEISRKSKEETAVQKENHQRRPQRQEKEGPQLRRRQEARGSMSDSLPYFLITKAMLPVYSLWLSVFTPYFI